MSDVRTRFAPSPTGHLHIGSARTALYNWLVARRNGGKFILRIEDTDRERSTQESVDSILEAMRWMGMDWDEGPEIEGPYGPYYQTKRDDIYLEHLNKLLAEGKAYRCYATKEELDEMRARAKETKADYHYDRRWRDKTEADWPKDMPYVIRFKAPLDGEIVVDDAIIGPVTFPVAQHVDDFVIARSDGTPTYNFVVVVDDVTMKITQVIRGDDHLNNTPKQILLYEAFGYPVPRFAHMPLTLGKDKTRLSKRHGATSVLAYRDMGYLPQALVNYLVRLGWSHGDEELFSKDELIKLFSIDDVGKSSGVFDQDKLDWISQQYIMKTAPATLAEALVPFLEKIGVSAEADARLAGIVEQLAPRSTTLLDMAEQAKFFFSGDFEYEEKGAKKFLKGNVLEPMKALIAALNDLEDFGHDTLVETFNGVLEQFDIKLGKLAQPVRVAITGRTASPGIFECLELVGKAPAIERLERAVGYIEKRVAENGQD